MYALRLVWKLAAGYTRGRPLPTIPRASTQARTLILTGYTSSRLVPSIFLHISQRFRTRTSDSWPLIDHLINPISFEAGRPSWPQSPLLRDDLPWAASGSLPSPSSRLYKNQITRTIPTPVTLAILYCQTNTSAFSSPLCGWTHRMSARASCSLAP